VKEIISYQNIEEAFAQLDNGGRFYNLFTKAKDEEINTAELARVAGLFSEKQQLILFLELSISQLSNRIRSRSSRNWMISCVRTF